MSRKRPATPVSWRDESTNKVARITIDDRNLSTGTGHTVADYVRLEHVRREFLRSIWELRQNSPGVNGEEVCDSCAGRYSYQDRLRLPCGHKYHEQCFAERIAPKLAYDLAGSLCAGGCDSINTEDANIFMDYYLSQRISLPQPFCQVRNEAVHHEISSETDTMAHYPRQLHDTSEQAMDEDNAEQASSDAEDDHFTEIRAQFTSGLLEDALSLASRYDDFAKQHELDPHEIAKCFKSTTDYKVHADSTQAAIELFDQFSVDKITTMLVSRRASYVASASAQQQTTASKHAELDLGSSLPLALKRLEAEESLNSIANFRQLYTRALLNNHVEAVRKGGQIQRKEAVTNGGHQSVKKFDVWTYIMEQYKDLSPTRGNRGLTEHPWKNAHNVGSRLNSLFKGFVRQGLFLVPDDMTPNKIRRHAISTVNLWALLTAKSHKGKQFQAAARACDPIVELVLRNASPREIVAAFDEALLRIFVVVRPMREKLEYRSFPLSFRNTCLHYGKSGTDIRQNMPRSRRNFVPYRRRAASTVSNHSACNPDRH